MSSEYRLSREERETHLWLNDADDTVEIFTESPVWLRKIKRIAKAYGVEVTPAGFHGGRVELPKKAVSLRKPRVLTAEQRREQGERLRKARESND